MSLKDYSVNRDHFRLRYDGSVGLDLTFPCCKCDYRDLLDSQEPCRICDHNANAVQDAPAPMTPQEVANA